MLLILYTALTFSNLNKDADTPMSRLIPSKHLARAKSPDVHDKKLLPALHTVRRLR